MMLANFTGLQQTHGVVTAIYENGRPLLLPRWRVQDIDTEEDWKSAELMHSLLWPSNSDD